MMQIEYNLQVRLKDGTGFIDWPLRITFERYDGTYRWTMIEFKVGGYRDRAVSYANVTESLEAQEAVDIEYESGRLFDAFNEHYRDRRLTELVG